jgi:sulfite exporter TauE/SafE
MNEIATPLAALVAGLVGSGHCVLMCGSIAGALATGGAACAGQTLRFPLLYNLGRITSYAAAGAVVGGAGGGLLALLGAPWLRAFFTTLAAIVIVVAGVKLAFGSKGFGGLDRLGAAAWRRIAPATRGLFPVTTPERAFAVGLAWGWLPCGMAYAMLAAAALSGGALPGALVMAMFGLGTLPAMIALGTGAAGLLGPRTRRAGGVVLVLLGLGSLAVAAWPGGAGHAAHAHPASVGVVGGGALDRVVPGQFAELPGVADADRLALDLDHAELGEPRE